MRRYGHFRKLRKIQATRGTKRAAVSPCRRGRHHAQLHRQRWVLSPQRTIIFHLLTTHHRIHKGDARGRSPGTLAAARQNDANLGGQNTVGRHDRLGPLPFVSPVSPNTGSRVQAFQPTILSKNHTANVFTSLQQAKRMHWMAFCYLPYRSSPSLP